MKYLSKITIVLTVLFFVSVELFAKVPDTAWTRTYGGADDDYGISAQQTSDGGYIVAGYTKSYGSGGFDVYLIKTNASGYVPWTRTYGGADGDYGVSVQQTTDGGYVVAGWTYSYGSGGADAYLIKTNASGDTLWTRTYGGADDDYGYWGQQTSDGGYIVVGETNSYGAGGWDVYLIKTNASGDTLWTKTYGGESGDAGWVVQQTSGGGYIVVGETYSYGSGGANVYLIKTNSSGDELWARTYGGEDWDRGYSVQQTSDGGYILVGDTRSYGSGGADVYLIKTNASGDTLWTRTYGGGGGEYGLSVQQTSDGRYIVAGWTYSYGSGGFDVYLIKTNASGDTLWTRTYGGGGDDESSSVQQTSDGGYIVVGYTKSYGSGDADVYLIKLKPEEGGIEEDINTGSFSLSSADPNPFTTKTTVRYELGKAVNVDISVYNMLGQKVRDLYSGKQSPGVHSVSWDGRGDSGEKSSSGIYLLRLEVEGKKASLKVMFVR